MKQKIIRGIIFTTVLIIGFGILCCLIYQEGWSEIVDTLINFGFIPFIGFVLISLINFGLYSLRWQLILNHHTGKDVNLSFWRMYKHRMAGFAVSYLTPFAQIGGEPVRIGMLISDKVDSKKATSSVTLDIAIELIAYISFIVAGIVLAIISGLSSGKSLIFIGIGLVVVLTILTAFLFEVAKGGGCISKLLSIKFFAHFKIIKKVRSWIAQMENMMCALLHTKKSFLFLIALLAIVAISFRVVEVFYIAYFFGVELSFAQAFLASTLPGIALLLPVPAGLGFFEGGFSGLFVLLGIPLSAVAFALVIRMRDIIFITFGCAHILRHGRHVVQDVIKKRAYANTIRKNNT
jgi:uncharacterized membrane protein YbhN (UPF0104 family)